MNTSATQLANAPQVSASRYEVLALVFIVIVYRIGLDWSYVVALEPYFSHLGFITDISALRVAESYLLTIATAIILPGRIRRPSDVLVLMLYCISICPTLSVYAMRGGAQLFVWFAALAFVTTVLVSRSFWLQFPRLKEGNIVAFSIALGGTALVCAWLVLSGGLQYFNLDLLNVYDTREAARETLYVGVFGYLNQWAFRIFNVVLIALAIYKRAWTWVVLLLLLQVFFFGISSEKKVLFIPLLVIALYVAGSFRYNPRIVVAVGLLGLIGMTLLADVFQQPLPYSLSVRRILFIPAMLNFAYHDFFLEAGHVYWSTSLFSSIIEYPYEESPAQMISYALRGDIDVWMNNGFLGSSFMHFGYAGMLFFGAIIGAIARVVDCLVVGKLPLWLGLSVVIVPFFNLFTGADLTTAVGTHGLGIALLLLWMLDGSGDGADRDTANRTSRGVGENN